MNQKEVILLTAFKLFAINGYDGISLNRIIKETGLTKGGFYYHFKSKDELFEESVKKYILNYYTEGIRNIVLDSKRNVKERLHDYYCLPARILQDSKNYFPAESNGYAFYFMFDAIRKFDSMKTLFAECYDELTKMLVELLQEGIDNNTIKKDVDIESLSIELVALLDGIQIYAAMAHQVDMEEQLKKFFIRTWNSIRK